MSTTPTQRTLRALRAQGRVCDIVERWIPRPIPGQGGNGFRKDLFGLVDVLVLDPETGFVGVQSCGSDFAAHYRKITEEKAEEAMQWLSTPGGNLELWGWRKVKLRRGSKAVRWSPRIHVFKSEDFG